MVDLGPLSLLDKCLALHFFTNHNFENLAGALPFHV